MSRLTTRSQGSRAGAVSPCEVEITGSAKTAGLVLPYGGFDARAKRNLLVLSNSRNPTAWGGDGMRTMTARQINLASPCTSSKVRVGFQHANGFFQFSTRENWQSSCIECKWLSDAQWITLMASHRVCLYLLGDESLTSCVYHCSALGSRNAVVAV